MKLKINYPFVLLLVAFLFHWIYTSTQRDLSEASCRERLLLYQEKVEYLENRIDKLEKDSAECAMNTPSKDF
jgi:hypothetical protein